MDTPSYTGALSLAFPRLSSEGFEIVGDPTDQYNCIAYAAGDTTEPWIHYTDYYWPENATRSANIQSLVEVFASLGFEQCGDSRIEEGYEKVALYEREGEWLHAAVQMPNGRWRSKMGQEAVIEHRSPESLSGGMYGNPTVYMRRAAIGTR